MTRTFPKILNTKLSGILHAHVNFKSKKKNKLETITFKVKNWISIRILKHKVNEVAKSLIKYVNVYVMLSINNTIKICLIKKVVFNKSNYMLIP